MIPLPAGLKRAAESAFRDNLLLLNLSAEEREEAARWYEAFAKEVVGRRAGLARFYNLERVRFLRGQVARIARRAPDFAVEIGHRQTGDEA